MRPWSSIARLSSSALACALLLACEPEPVRKPNLLFVSIDTLRADHLGCYGYSRPTSPNLDALAERAVLFENANSSSSWTLPSLTSLMTSLYAATHGCASVQTRLDPSFDTLAEVLRHGGYDTAMVGGHLFLGHAYGLTQGFTHVDAEIVQDDATRSSPEVADQGIRWLEQKAAAKDGSPWMLWLHFFDPHDTYLPHEGISERFGTERKIDLYDGEIAFTDLHVGRVLDALARLGLEGETIVVLTADHGEEFGEHGNTGHGYTLYQEAVHVPLIVRVPPGVASTAAERVAWTPRRVAPVVSTVDLAPTLLSLCGLEPRTKVEGEPLTPLLAADPDDVRSAISEVSWHAGQRMSALQIGGFKHVDHQYGQEKLDLLFDLESDRGEVCNEADRDPYLLQAFKDELRRRLEHARGLGLEYTPSRASALSPEELERMKRLGYIGEDE